MRKINFFVATLTVLMGAISATNAAEFSVEDYGQLPFIRSLSISPNGENIAYIQRSEAGDYFVIADASTLKIKGGADARNIKARLVYFATDQYVILIVSKTSRANNIIGKWENSAAFIYNLKTKKMKHLLKGSKGLYPAQGGLGYIVGMNIESETLYMPAWVGKTNPDYSLLRVDMKSGRGRIHVKGTPHTRDWFVDKEGNVLAKEEYNKQRQEYRILARHGKKWKEIHSKETAIPLMSIQAVSGDEKYLIFDDTLEQGEAVYKMSLEDGSVEGPLFAKEGVEIDEIIIRGLNREFSGVLYSGLIPDYSFFNEKKQKNFSAMQKVFPTSSVRQVSSTKNGSKIVYLVSGNDAAGEYYILDTAARSMSVIASNYPNIKKEDIGEIKVVHYKARDGLPINAVVTWPVGVSDRSKLPMLVFPHGGPESYSQMNFSWWAQYFARSGYVVLEPNFRGSSGSGVDFRKAGRGEWGRAMQDDLSDGVAAMIEAGHVDPSRVCIMGGSYGGYAALAGGAFTPDLYKCVISVAGVSDLPRMLADVKFHQGNNHWVVSYWHEVIGDSKSERQKLKEISPVNFAENFNAPVLLLHGRDDTVVNIRQSRRMMTALKKANKQVELVTLEGEDHWLSDSDTRLRLLKSISEFLQEHNPAVLQ